MSHGLACFFLSHCLLLSNVREGFLEHFIFSFRMDGQTSTATHSFHAVSGSVYSGSSRHESLYLLWFISLLGEDHAFRLPVAEAA